MTLARNFLEFSFVLAAAVGPMPMAMAQSVQTYDRLQFRTPEGAREEMPTLLQFTQVRGKSFCRFGV